MIRFVRVESHSMAPSLRDGAVVPARSLRRSTPLRRGDVVVVDSAELGRRVVKRVVGLPGETVTLAAGRVAIDGVPLAEPYASPSYFTGEYRVPDGHYFLLGDNRDASSDSRTWQQPYVARDTLVERLLTPRRRAGRRSA